MSKIREAVNSDSVFIKKLSLDLGYEMASQDVADKRLSEILKSKTDKLFVFEKGNQIKGWIHIFVAMRVASPPFVEIGGLVVSSCCRREGIGRSLVKYARHWAKAKNLKIRVRCNSKRTATHTFYRSLGFSNSKSQQVFEAIF